MIKEKKKIDFIYVIYKNYSETYKSILSLTDFLRDSGFSINIYISDNSFKEAKEVDIKLASDNQKVAPHTGWL